MYWQTIHCEALSVFAKLKTRYKFRAAFQWAKGDTQLNRKGIQHQTRSFFIVAVHYTQPFRRWQVSRAAESVQLTCSLPDVHSSCKQHDGTLLSPLFFYLVSSCGLWAWPALIWLAALFTQLKDREGGLHSQMYCIYEIVRREKAIYESTMQSPHGLFLC